MPLDPATDWKRFSLMPWESISHVSIRPSNLPNVTSTIPYSTWGKITNRQLMQTNGALVRPESSVLIPRHTDNANGNVVAKPGDQVVRTVTNPTDGSSTITFTIQTVETDNYYQFWSVFNPAIAFNLRDLVNIPVATDVLSTTATRTTTFANEATSVICRRQPTSTELKTFYGHQADSRMFDIFFAVNYAFQPHKHTISWSEGSDTIVADIVRVDQSDRIDVCQRVMVEVRP